MSYRSVISVVLAMGFGLPGAFAALGALPPGAGLAAVAHDPFEAAFETLRMPGPDPSAIHAQETNLRLARDVLGLADAGPLDLWGAVALAQRIHPTRLATLPSVPLRPLAKALEELADRHGEKIEPDRLAPYADLPPLHQAALGATVNAFLALDDAARTPPELAMVAAARNGLLEASARLHDVLLQFPLRAPPPPLAVPPAFSVDLAGVRNAYQDDVALQIDAGGDDRYHNHAGGSCTALPAAALFDYGGNDGYGPANTSLGDCGANGGANSGAALLVDTSGNDRYVGGLNANGGATLGGLALLVDLSGRDRYTASGTANGAGTLGGVGVLIDGSGNDRYFAVDNANAAGNLAGVGVLFDLGGHDAYTCLAGHGNAGSAAGSALLVDAGGKDEYRVGSFGNAFTSGGASLLVDARGNDEYNGTFESVNGAASVGGVGHLLDLNGDDRYDSLQGPANGGGLGRGLGVLIDRRGDDRYRGLLFATNGGGAQSGVGVLLDAEGDDGYLAQREGVNGGGKDLGIGLLIDLAGRDRYQDDEGGSGQDVTVAPKGSLGAQIDL